MLTRPKRNREGIPVMTLMMENETPKFCWTLARRQHKHNRYGTDSHVTKSDHVWRWASIINFKGLGCIKLI